MVILPITNRPCAQIRFMPVKARFYPTGERGGLVPRLPAELPANGLPYPVIGIAWRSRISDACSPGRGPIIHQDLRLPDTAAKVAESTNFVADLRLAKPFSETT